MITGDARIIENTLSQYKLDYEFKCKPLVFGGLAMDYYGLRKRGHDIDFMISNADYQALAEKYPDCKKDMWGDLGLVVGEYELFRSVCRLDYDFFSVGALEYGQFKVMSFERLFLMKVLAFKHQPEVPRHTDDFELAVQFVYDNFCNKEYAEYASKHIDSYIAAPNGTIFNENY